LKDESEDAYRRLLAAAPVAPRVAPAPRKQARRQMMEEPAEPGPRGPPPPQPQQADPAASAAAGAFFGGVAGEVLRRRLGY
jgi:hypothetical protein